MDEGAKVKRRPRARLIFGVAVKDWLALKEGDWSGDTLRIERTNFGHLAGHFGGMSLRDISAEDISHYKTARKGAKASPKTIALELGSLRALMRKRRLWADLQPDVKIPVGRRMMSAGAVRGRGVPVAGRLQGEPLPLAIPGCSACLTQWLEEPGAEAPPLASN